MSTPSEELLAKIRQLHEKQSLRRQLVHVSAVRDNKRVSIPHLLVGGRLVELTPEQLTDLEDQ